MRLYPPLIAVFYAFIHARLLFVFLPLVVFCQGCSHHRQTLASSAAIGDVIARYTVLALKCILCQRFMSNDVVSVNCDLAGRKGARLEFKSTPGERAFTTASAPPQDRVFPLYSCIICNQYSHCYDAYLYWLNTSNSCYDSLC